MVNATTVAGLARPHGGHCEPPIREGADTARPARAGALDAPEPATPFSEDALALEFTSRHGERLRFVNAWGKWFEWTGTRWQDENTLHVFDLARSVCRHAATEAKSPNAAFTLSKSATISAVERLARADRRHATTTDRWDADPWLLNTPNGVVDLRTGEMTPHRADLYMTKITAVGPGGECPRWVAFLRQVTGGDQEMVDFLQRALGYALTGITREHALLFIYGTGANGKSVLLNCVAGLMGDYATVAPMEAFTASVGDRHPTDMAGLRGARLVTAQETEEGRLWAEARIKSLTGGDPITARFMRQDFFTFTPQFKLVIAGNHKPGLRNVDEAVRRRLHLIPFGVTIPAGDRDPFLPEILKAEWPGILKWMITGCLKWQKIGLKPPPAVVEATAEYLEVEDSFSAWLAECCEPGAGGFEPSARLFASWSQWAHVAGEAPRTQKWFAEQMEARGYRRAKRSKGKVRGFTDITIVAANEQGAGKDVGRPPPGDTR